MRRGMRITWWALRRHPRRVLRIAAFAGRHRKALAAGRRVMAVGTRVREAASDTEMRGEAKSAVSAVSRAARRARDVGVAEALADQTVIDQLRRAVTHASHAAAAATSPRRRRRSIVRPAAITAGTCLLAGAIYVRGKRYLRSR